jgi:hypothetical protein
MPAGLQRHAERNEGIDVAGTAQRRQQYVHDVCRSWSWLEPSSGDNDLARHDHVSGAAVM